MKQAEPGINCGAATPLLQAVVAVAVTNPLPTGRMTTEKLGRCPEVHTLFNIKQHMNLICVT
jgi:hypothetical protein